jgi:hypothetical protein
VQPGERGDWQNLLPHLDGASSSTGHDDGASHRQGLLHDRVAAQDNRALGSFNVLNPSLLKKASVQLK